MPRTLNFIDLFAGAGGLSEGFINAGYNPIAHVEMDKAACFTLKTRQAFHYLRENNQEHIYWSYVKGDMSRDDFYAAVPDKILQSVINASIGKNNKNIFRQIDDLKGKRTVDLIIGGPPCQAYSYIGRAAMKNKVDTDQRNFLYKEYGKFLKKYTPKLFVFENVPGIKTAGEGQYFKNLKSYFKRIGYELDDRAVNSFDFEVVQNRERVIIIGWKKGTKFAYPDFGKIENNWTRDDIFYDLPPLRPAQGARVMSYTLPTKEYLQKTGLRNGVDFVSQHVTRPHNSRDLKIYKRAIFLLEEEGKRLKNNEIPDEERTQKNTSGFLDRFKVVGVKPHTMIAHIAKDGHHFIHPDKNQLRSISVREAARIQSFPDSYFFEGVKEQQFRSAAFRQIGNAVPPLMANEIAVKIKTVLDEHK
jgi:DNA (cytosine-5)-methyltransferase 1